MSHHAPGHLLPNHCFTPNSQFTLILNLFHTTNIISITQVEGGVWTYMEEAIGITCGNLPLLQPLVRHFFSNKDSRVTIRGSNALSYGFGATIKSDSNSARLHQKHITLCSSRIENRPMFRVIYTHERRSRIVRSHRPIVS